MGRYYAGDIEGKFWVGVQSSNDGEFFGAKSEVISYTVDDIEEVEEGLKKCRDVLGEEEQNFDNFFNKVKGYNVEMLLEEGLDPALLEWYARLQLGLEIHKCMVETGECYFEAEF